MRMKLTTTTWALLGAATGAVALGLLAIAERVLY